MTKGDIHSHTYSVGLFKKSLYMYYSNALLKEDVYVFEGQQLETLYDIENMLLQIIYILKIPKENL